MSDLISRQAAIDALDKQCDIVCQYSKKQRSVMCGACPLGTAFDVIEELPSAEPEIKCIAKVTLTDDQVKEAFEKAKDAILTVEPERKKGKWIIDRHGNWACDQCGNDPYHCNMENMNFCPNCGADMRGENEAPTVDAVPIVRCKDCKFWIREKAEAGEAGTYCGEADGMIKPGPDDFCGRGRRKERDDRSHPFADDVMMGGGEE